ncbi:MAG: heparinase, partial [Gammaproteobacteria bacterium]|nr:heparinase [Gammaproteobacteria bacterium]
MTPLSIGGQALRLWNTLRYLKPVQIYGRIWRNVYTPRADLQPAPALCPHNLKAWKHPATRHASLLDGNRFSFLGQTHALHDIGWDNPNIDKLWRYNLHYFDDLNAKGAEARRDWHVRLIVDWIQNNPPGKGTGWEPYPTSLRIVNWIKWALAGNELPD